MRLWTLLRRDAFRSVRPLLGLAALSGLAHVAVLTTVNEAIARLTDADAVSRLLILFIGSNLLFVVCQIQYMRMASGRIERAIVHLRTCLIDSVCSAELLKVGAIGHARVTEALSSEFQTISQAVPIMVVGTHCAVVIVLSSIYVYTLSLPTFCLLLLIAGGNIFIAVRSSRKMGSAAGGTHDALVELADHISGLLAGFREAKMNRVRSEKIRGLIARSAESARQQRMVANVGYAFDYTTSESIYYMSVAAVVFVLPAIATVRLDMVTMAANAISFIVYPLHIMMSSLPTYLGAENAAGTILSVAERLAPETAAPAGDAGVGPGPAWTSFATLSLDNLGFRHQAASGGFAVGPISLRIDRGELVFVTGGNGSGKSTMMHMLLGLYQATRGRIRVDGTVVDAGNLDSYRQLFSVIFSDNHLTREILGTRAVNEALAEALLELLEIGDKVRIEDGVFTSIALSGGQRKRLALIAALLEERPILVLDEWAADQSPQFRETFYRTILPWIRDRGTTVVAVTHDDKYFDLADQLLDVSAGRVTVLSSKASRMALAS